MRISLIVIALYTAVVAAACNGGPDAPSPTTQISLVSDGGTWVDCGTFSGCRLQITARNSGPACAADARALIRFRNAEGAAIGDYPAVRDGFGLINPGELHTYHTSDWLQQPPAGATYTASFTWTTVAC
jgi:hypothetical protein